MLRRRDKEDRLKKPRHDLLTDQELEIMKVVWERGTVTVRDVYEKLHVGRKIAYTTVMTMRGILEQKGHLTKAERERAYVNRPSEPRRNEIGRMVQDFVTRVFDGSAEPLLVHMVKNQKLDQSQLAEIEELVKARRRKK
jgi:predicted transcriptional regulator